MVSAAVAVAFLPALQPAGPGNTGPVDAAILAAIGAFLLWGLGVRRLRLPYGLALGVFIAGGCIGALRGPVPTQGLLAILQDLFLLAWCAAVANLCRRPENLAAILHTWVWASFAWGAFLVVALSTQHLDLAGVGVGQGTRAGLTFGDPNLAGDYFFVSLMLATAARYPARNAVRWVCYGVLLTALAFTGSNGGFVALLAGLGLTVIITMIRRNGLLPVIGILAILALAATFITRTVDLRGLAHRTQISDNLELKYSVARSPESLRERTLLLKESIGLFDRGSIFGSGPLSTKARLDASQAAYVKEAHDDYMAALVERGILGLAGLFLLLFSLAGRTWAVVSRPVPPELARVVPQPAALGGAVLGLITSGLFYETLHFRHLWAVFGIVAAWSFSREP